MKSSFLVSIVLGALMCASAVAQTSGRKKVSQRRTRVQQRAARKPVVKKETPKPSAPATKTSTQAVSTTAAAEKSPFDKFYDRLSISYFGVFTSPTLEDWNSSNAALSPALGDTGKRCHRNCDTYAMNVWNQVNFAYDFGWLMKFVVIPRWTVYLNNPRDMSRSIGEDRAMVGLEDFLVGFAGTIITSEDKKFNWFVRPAMRLPTSHFSRHYRNGDFGSITHQLEISHYVTYDVSPQLQLGLQMQQRLWVYDYRYNPSRLRFYTSPYISYALSDHTRLQAYYQSMIENNKRWESVNGKKPVFKDIYQDIMLGVSQDITDRFNIMPYLGVFVDDVPLSTRSAYIGSWISYKIK